ncbi:Uncharacterised protein [Vibrio cholerae]|uniref:Uncharacterized protein n=1 Tax=Vibrio cholerae TaxID=666 RepID=A0A655NXY0_VIBCL|nr:Uncharacterised protein [Vibrio cholerae]CRZ66996.1 Uncharacterised protein [Vibrio cholerae]CRZ71471.1 Uncharacterised protein [Vibrio cholerae]CRZ74924.1 Uncharacterised protein [Vibrio cholerae]CRZ84108.1 Uncharacterised protein [Vibrio cholerae]
MVALDQFKRPIWAIGQSLTVRYFTLRCGFGFGSHLTISLRIFLLEQLPKHRENIFNTADVLHREVIEGGL